jgi:hypothetical protein
MDTAMGTARKLTRRERFMGGAVAAFLSMTLATPGPLLPAHHAASGLDLLVWLGLLGAPVVFLTGMWLAPLVLESLLEAAVVMGAAAAFGGWLFVTTLAAIGAAIGPGEGWTGFGFVFALGLPIAILIAIVLTIPMGALWACLLRGAWGRA